MTEVIGVRFKQVGKIYYFSPNGVQMPIGEKVIVETARGIECGEVAIANREIDDEGIVKPLKTVIRKKKRLLNFVWKKLKSINWI